MPRANSKPKNQPTRYIGVVADALDRLGRGGYGLNLVAVGGLTAAQAFVEAARGVREGRCLASDAAKTLTGVAVAERRRIMQGAPKTALLWALIRAQVEIADAERGACA